MAVVDGGLDPADLRRICLAVPEPLVELFQRDLVAVFSPVRKVLSLQPCEILLNITPGHLVERLLQRATDQPHKLKESEQSQRSQPLGPACLVETQNRLLVLL